MANEEFQPVYVLVGSDAFLRDSYYKEILKRVVGDADPQTCISTFDSSVELADVLDELRTLPFLAPSRVVTIRDADAFVSAHREKLEAYVESPSETSALVLMVSSFPGNTRLAKAVKKVGKVLECSIPDRENLSNWLVKSAGKREKKITPDAAQLLEQWRGKDLAALNGEVEKLSLYVGQRDTITADDVAQVVAATAGPASFALTNAITNQDTAAALKALNGVLTTRGAEFSTLGQIGWHIRNALAAQQSLANGQQPNLRMPPSQRSAFMRMLQRRSLRKLQADMRRLIAADLAMKSGTSAKSALQEVVVALCN